MQRFLIIAANGALLVFLLIGFPAATRAQVGNLQFSSASTGQRLMFLELGIATAGNIFAALFFIKGRKEKILCWEWAAVFGALGGHAGIFQFRLAEEFFTLAASSFLNFFFARGKWNCSLAAARP